MPNRVDIDYIGDGREDRKDISKEIHRALLSNPKDISYWPKYLYDSRGSELFEEITEQPEYYQTRSELEILQKLSRSGLLERGFSELIELGSGSSSKTRVLLEAMSIPDGSFKYVPLDVSENALKESADALLEDYPSLHISGYVGDFDGAVGDFLCGIPESEKARLVIFLGGTIGNFSESGRAEFLEGIRKGLSREDRFLVGLDLVKDVRVLEAAYDDEAGVTAAFNRNVLEVLNRSIGSNFDPALFSHRSSFNREQSRIEMWLDALVDQDVYISTLDVEVHFSRGEGLRTEVSHKFTRESARNMFEGSGMRLVELYTDDRELFGLALAEPE